jgi:hypothetical protein
MRGVSGWSVGSSLYGALPNLPLRIDEKVYVGNHRTPTPEEVARVVAKLPPEAALMVQLLGGHRRPRRRGDRACGATRSTPQAGVLRLDGKTGPRDFPLTDGLIALLGDRIDGTATSRSSPRRRGREAAPS